MSAIDYAGLAQVATDLVRDAGRALILRSASPTDTYDPVTGTTTLIGTGTETPFNGVTLSIDEKYAQTIGTENIQLRDELVYMEPSVVVPRLEDEVLIDGNPWEVVHVSRIAPNGIPLLYILQVRP